MVSKAEHDALSDAVWRAEEALRDAIEILRNGGDTRLVLNEGIQAYQAVASDERKRRRPEAALLDVSQAGLLIGSARLLPQLRAARPPGCARIPRPEDLIAVLNAAYAQQITPKEGDAR